jgi:hypothetical protein
MCASDKHSIEATTLIMTKCSIMDSNVELRINQCQDNDTRQKYLHSGMLRVTLLSRAVTHFYIFVC